jgi:hypothetical protein
VTRAAAPRPAFRADGSCLLLSAIVCFFPRLSASFRDKADDDRHSGVPPRTPPASLPIGLNGQVAGQPTGRLLFSTRERVMHALPDHDRAVT